MNLSRARHTLEVATNVAVLVAAVATIAFFARACVSNSARKPEGKLEAGAPLADIQSFNYGDTPKTLVLALSTGCKYCANSAPFYQKLIAKHSSLAGHTRLLAVFPEAEEKVTAFLRQHQLKIDFRPNIDLVALHVSATPTVILVNKGGNILDSWIGSISPESEGEVLKALDDGDPSDSRTTEPRGTAAIAQTISLFDESSPLLTIRSEGPHKDDISSSINFFDVDQQGDIFLATDTGVVKYNDKGEHVAEIKAPQGFRGVFCVDLEGNTYLPSGKGVLKYNSALTKYTEILIPKVFTADNIIVKMESDGSQNAVYLQTYEPKSLNQVLYRVDLATLKVDPIFKLEKPVKFSPTLTAGAFDFALGREFLYVSDIHEYKIFVYSRTTGKYVKTFSRPFSANPISGKDGDLKNRKLTVAGLTDGPNKLTYYPPILHLNVAGNGMLVVWTSRRNEEQKQVVEVYDDEFKLIGVDLKYANPTINNHLFKNGNVYIPDLGFGRSVSAPGLSPLDVPFLPLSLKVFRLDPRSKTKPAEGGKE